MVRQCYDGSQPIVALEIEGRTAAEIRTVASKHLSSADQAKLADAVDRAIYSISCSSLKHKYPELAKQLKISSEMGLDLALTLNDVYKSAYSWAELVQHDLEEIGQYVPLFDIEREIALNLNRPPTQVVSDRGLVSRYSFYHQEYQLFDKYDFRLQ